MKLREAAQSIESNSISIPPYDVRILTTSMYVRSHVGESTKPCMIAS